MKALKSLTLIVLAALMVAAQTATSPKPAELPKVVTATESQSLRFRNSLLEIQNLRLSAERDTARANLLQAALPEQITAIQKENKIDERYQVLRGAGGAYILNEDGLLQFSLKEAK